MLIIYKYGRLNARRGSARDEFDQSEFSLSLTLSLSRLEPRGVRVPSRKHINQLFHVNTRAQNIALPSFRVDGLCLCFFSRNTAKLCMPILLFPQKFSLFPLSSVCLFSRRLKNILEVEEVASVCPEIVKIETSSQICLPHSRLPRRRSLPRRRRSSVAGHHLPRRRRSSDAGHHLITTRNVSSGKTPRSPCRPTQT